MPSIGIQGMRVLSSLKVAGWSLAGGGGARSAHVMKDERDTQIKEKLGATFQHFCVLPWCRNSSIKLCREQIGPLVSKDSTVRTSKLRLNVCFFDVHLLEYAFRHLMHGCGIHTQDCLALQDLQAQRWWIHCVHHQFVAGEHLTIYHHLPCPQCAPVTLKHRRRRGPSWLESLGVALSACMQCVHL